MNLAQEVPKELKDFAIIMDKIAYRNGGYSEVFTDFIDYMLACFLTTGDKELAERLQHKYKKDYSLFNELLKAYLFCQNDKIRCDTDWYDGFGIIYETIASRWKSSAMGQFFTPPSLVNVMTAITQGDAREGGRQAISDPCCGSGRMLIAAHANASGNFQYGADIDPICAKMTALNMMIHGCVGEACCMDTIQYTYHFSYAINPYLHLIKKPMIEKIERWEQSFFYIKEPEKAVILPPKPVERGAYIAPKLEATTAKNGQMRLF